MDISPLDNLMKEHTLKYKNNIGLLNYSFGVYEAFGGRIRKS